MVDAEGVYIENIALHSYLESDVINAINAKYGTNFTHLTMFKVTGIAIGDDCPDWDAYEKIGIKLVNGFYKYDITNGQNTSFVAMQCEDGLINLYAADVKGEEKVIVYDNEGSERTSSSSSSLIEMVQSKAELYSNYQGIVLMIKDHNPIANWSEYKPL